MRRYILLLSVFGFLIHGELLAQFVKVTGSVVDRDSDEPLPAATVKAILSNGSEETFAITNEKGMFNIELPRPGNYRFEFSYVSYNKNTKEANIRPGNNALGKIRMKENVTELTESKIIGKNMRVRQIADTTVYNADGYKVMDGATAEELIKKMPGMNITDGKIEAQGEEVKKVLVDGKPFFENDPQLALKTLPAEVVQSVAVFDKKSDQAEFTGFDDGNTVKAIDVKTRSYKRNGVFGKVYGQYGSDDRYNFGGNVNYFSGERRITLLGLFNNVNQQNFSIDDILGTMSGPGPKSGGGGGPMPPRQGGGMSNAVSSQSGISKTNALGVNYSDNWGDKVSVQGSYFFNMTNNHLVDSLNRAYFDTISGHRDYYQLSDKTTDNYSHRFNMRLTYKPTESDEIMFMPNISHQKTYSESYSYSETMLDGSMQNSSGTESLSESNGYNMSADLLWRHKFVKDGRTVSVMANGALSKNESSSNQYILLNEETTNQLVDNNSDGYRFGGNIVYTEPISHNQQLSVSYAANFTNSTSDKITTEDNEGMLTIDKYLSNDYVSEYMTQSAGVGYRVNSEKVRVMANLSYQRADLKGEQNFPYYTEQSYITNKNYYSFLPMLMLDYNPSQNRSVRIMYRSASAAPSVTQLQSTIDNGNPLQLYQGDPNLDQTISHDLSVRFISSNLEKATNWMAYVSATKKFDYIGSDITIVDEDTSIDDNVILTKGGQITRPVNLDDYLSLKSNLTYGFPVDFLMSNLNISAGVNYSETPGVQNGNVLLTKSLSMVPGASLTSNISSDLDFSLSYNADFNKVKSNLENSGNYDYLTHTGNAKISWVIWKGFVLENNLNWKCYTGSSMEEKEQFYIWNASLGKKFLKNNKAELKISAYDLLEQNRSFTRTIADTYTQTSYSNVLGRYFMLTFTYNIQNFKANKKS